jgi:hypothetical protein
MTASAIMPMTPIVDGLHVRGPSPSGCPGSDAVSPTASRTGNGVGRNRVRRRIRIGDQPDVSRQISSAIRSSEDARSR